VMPSGRLYAAPLRAAANTRGVVTVITHLWNVRDVQHRSVATDMTVDLEPVCAQVAAAAPHIRGSHFRCARPLPSVDSYPQPEHLATSTIRCHLFTTAVLSTTLFRSPSSDFDKARIRCNAVSCRCDAS